MWKKKKGINNYVCNFQVVVFTICKGRAESDDLASFSDTFYEGIASDINNDKVGKPTISDSEINIKNSKFRNTQLRVDKNGKKEAPHLFLFKKSPACTSNSTHNCKQRHERNSQYVLVDTIYRDKYKKTAPTTTNKKNATVNKQNLH